MSVDENVGEVCVADLAADDDEQLLARKIRQMLLGETRIDSDEDDAIVKRKIKERLEDSPHSSASEERCRVRSSHADMFADSDDASSEDPQPALVDRPRKPSARTATDSSSSSSSSSDENETKSRRTRRGRGRRGAGKVGAMDVETIYSELQEIHLKLRSESAAMKVKEEQLLRREAKLNQAEEMYSEILENEKRESLEEVESVYQRDMDQLNELYREKCRENKRLKENFDAIKATNDTLKNQLGTLTNRHEKLERQSTSLQGRLVNLQRVQTNSETRQSPLVIKPAEKEVEMKPKVKARPPASMSEVLAVLLEWLAESQLKEVTRSVVAGVKDELNDQSLERAVKILPHLADLLREGVPQGGRMDLPCLQFIYWSLYKMDQIQGIHRTTLSSTLRRLGDEFYRPRSLTFDCDQTKMEVCERNRSREGRFFRSDDLQERFLSSLIVLKTLTQADLVAHVFDVVKSDLKENLCKEMFIHYRAMNVFLNFFKPANPSLLSSTCDLLLQLSMESRVLDEFLKACSTEAWFRQCVVILKSPAIDRKIIEKLSVVLQKLSKLRCNRRLLDTYGISSAVQDLLRECRDENAFLALNLKSIQYNLIHKS